MEVDRWNCGEDSVITDGYLEAAMILLVRTHRVDAYRNIGLGKQMNVNAITTPGDFDPDTAPDLSRDEWPAKLAQVKVQRGRPPLERPKVLTTIRLSQDVVDHFKAGGRGWRTRINEVLQEYISRSDSA